MPASVMPRPQAGEAPGRPWPLGATVVAQTDEDGPAGLNVAVWAPDATAVDVSVFDAEGRVEQARHRLPVCTDGVWHGRLPGLGVGTVYGLRAHGPWAPREGHRFNPAKVLLDPWAQAVVGRYGGPGVDLGLYVGHVEGDPAAPDPLDNAAVALKARVVAADPRPAPAFDRPRVPADRTVLYEAHVRALTMRHPDVPEALRGSYAGVAHPAVTAHLRALGVTTLSLLPIHARADEARLQQLGLSNHWGYSTVAYLAPEPRYWSGRPGTTPEGECRAMVEALHAAGLEVVLDVVFNHTAETDEDGPMLSLRGLANARAYHLQDAEGRLDRYVNWSGCGNCLNLNEPRLVELVLGALRHWVRHYGVDGFRFDLAPVLGRGAAGQGGRFSRTAPFFAALQADPVLSRVRLIAEPWDIGPGGYQLGAFPPGWAEWNDQFRDTVRAWWLRGGADRGALAHRFAASSAQFRHDHRAPTASVNFITAHDGFTLHDLVSFDHKHNHANGEHNHDGHHHNCSWNAGVEGPSDDPAIVSLRLRLRRALLATLLLAQGTPMLLAGDELGHSQQGNNNAYCQDNPVTWLDWSGRDGDLQRCVQRLLALRAALPALRQAQWLSGERRDGATDVLWWHPDGHPMAPEDWHACDDRTLLIRLQARDGSPAVLLVIHAGAASGTVVPPPVDDEAGAPTRWFACFDSSQPAGAALRSPETIAFPHFPTIPARSVQVFCAMAPSPDAFPELPPSDSA
jgi:glycogen operon protein